MSLQVEEFEVRLQDMTFIFDPRNLSLLRDMFEPDIPPVQSMPSDDGFEVVPPSAAAHIPLFTEVKTLFISRLRREGMGPLLKRHGLSVNNLRNPSRGLLVHFHGGGFIAGSPFRFASRGMWC